MAGLIAALFGGKRSPDTNPHPGEGGYDLPRGPVGEGGFPGSTPAAVQTHTQTTDGKPQRKLSASAAQDEWKQLPTRRLNGSPRQPYARNKRQADDTTTHYTPVISQGVPGNSNQRNTVYNGGRKAAPDGTNRYVYNGPNGGFESEATDRRIPYTIHHRPEHYRGTAAVRGADLSGQRYTMARGENLNQGGHGHYGISRKRGPLHRPVRFQQPGPWTQNYYDVSPHEGSQAPNMVHRSASNRPQPKPKKHRANEVETRRTVRQRGVSNGRRG